MIIWFGCVVVDYAQTTQPRRPIRSKSVKLYCIDWSGCSVGAEYDALIVAALNQSCPLAFSVTHYERRTRR